MTESQVVALFGLEETLPLRTRFSTSSRGSIYPLRPGFQIELYYVGKQDQKDCHVLKEVIFRARKTTRLTALD